MGFKENLKAELTYNKTPVYFSPEVRQMAHIVEKLNPDYRKIALSFIETLKKHEDSQRQKDEE
jgi:tRNA A58 N-methylase Trm61